jgi:hypothetical protein
MKPKKESNREDISDRRSEKKGMTSAYITVKYAYHENNGRFTMIKAPSHVIPRIPAHEAHPITVLEVLCLVPSKMRKKTNRAETDAYRTPRKIKVGIMNENETFLKTSLPREPNAGELMY